MSNFGKRHDKFLSVMLGWLAVLPLVLVVYLNSMTGPSRGFLSGDFVAHVKFAEDISLQKILQLGLPHLTMHMIFRNISEWFSLSLTSIFFIYTSLCVL